MTVGLILFIVFLLPTAYLLLSPIISMIWPGLYGKP